LIDLLSTLWRSWSAMIGTSAMVAGAAFLCLLLLVDLMRRGWRMSWSRRAVASVLATFAIFNINLILLPLVWLGADKVKECYVLAGIPSIPTEAWSRVPLVVLIPIAVLAHDFANYWNHRLMHLPWLWPVHAIHHSDPEVNGTTAYRIHILEKLVMWISYVLLLSWLGLPDNAIGIGAVFVVLHTIYIHINVDWGHGPFRLLLASPRFHRWHHADVPEAHGKNLANICPLWDWLFGTYYCPGACEVRVGAAGVPENDVVRLLLWPMREWGRMMLSPVRAYAGRWARGSLLDRTRQSEVQG
jgi:sterol desaturase/sphingolipid hydroxylase (fatty acid hydroxylase superfamily)